MRVHYDQDAVELCRKLYCKYGGRNHLLIEREMKKVYPSWRSGNLYDKGKGTNARMGWITRFGFDNSLRMHLEKLTAAVNDDEQDLYIGIRTARKSMQVKVIGKNASKDDIYQYRDFCKLEIEARRNLDLSRDNLETFVSGYEKLLVWLGELDPQAAKVLVRHGDRLAELAQAHYGKTETEFDGAIDREDESGSEPFSLLT
ncbi:MAG: hypothetical protein ABI539_11675 [Acidobacteriota bacterium]